MTQYYSIKGYDYLTNIFCKCLIFLEGSNILDNAITLRLTENYQAYRIDSDNSINTYKYNIKDKKLHYQGTFFDYMNLVDFVGIKGEYSIFSGTCSKYKINT